MRSAGQEWWNSARSASHDLAPKVRLVGAAKERQSESETLRAKRDFLHRHLLRLGLIAALQKSGWFRFRGRKDYLQAFHQAWHTGEGAYRFDQRLGMLFFSAVSQPSQRARELVREHVGEVPFLGTGLFQRERLEQEFDSSDGFAVVPEELHTWFFERGGIDLACALSERLLEGSVVNRCRREIRDFLTSEPSDRPAHERVWEMHVHDPACQGGNYLAAMLGELVAQVSDVDASDEPDRVAGLVPRVLEKCVSGLEGDPTLAQEARFRIAIRAFLLQGCTKPLPLPDLRDVIRQGRPLGRSSNKLEEGARVELKATFEWNSRKKERSGELRLGTLRTIAGFMNADGGTLFIGVADGGTPIGIDDDLALLDDPYPIDVFENRLREFLKNHLDPVPLNAVHIDFPNISGKTVCRVAVEPRPGVTYILRKGPDGRTLEEVYVRDGNRTLNLTGRMRDQFVLSRSPG